MKLNRSTSIGILLIAAVSLFLARPFAAESPKTDVERGAEIVATGTSYGVAACARCHAFDGTADGSGAFPKLSGIPAYYLSKQLRDFASGARTDAIMSAIARKMNPEDIAEVSEYYSAVHGTTTPAPPADPDVLVLGARLATVGDQEKEIQACESCHGARGRGQAPAIPPLAGQYAHYIEFQIGMWQKGYRKNDANQQMTNIAKRLGPKDVQAIALYFERLPQPNLGQKNGQP